MQREILDSESVLAERPYRVRDIIFYALTIDQRFNNGFEGIRRGLRIVKAIDKVETLGEFCLDEGDWEVLCKALQEPAPIPGRTPYLLSPGYACLPLIELVLNARIKE